MMNLKKFLALLMALSMVLALAACGSSSSESSSSESTSDTTEATEATETAEATDETDASELKYAVILKTQSTSFWLTMYNAIQEYVEENGLNVDLYNAKSDDDYESQLAILEQCVNSGEYAGIAIAPCSSVNMITGVKMANEAGITIVNIDEQFDADEMESQGATCVAFVSSDNESIGYMGAEYLCTLIEEGSQVGVIEGIAGNASSDARASGAKAAFEDYGMDIVADKACDWDMQTALDTVSAWITQYPDLKAIYCCNDGMAAGVRQAVLDAGVDILVCGTDGDDDALEAVQAGTMTATVAQDPGAIGVTSLQLLIDACQNPGNYTSVAAPEKTGVDAVLVSLDYFN